MLPKSCLRYNLVVAGSGSAAFNEECVADVVIRQAHKVRQLHNRVDAAKPIIIGYVGTCTYDSPVAKERQTNQLAKKGCKIIDINVTWPQNTRPMDELRHDILGSDVLLFSGGNTLYAMRRFIQLGLEKVFREAADAGIIFSGGSAGSILPFDAGHSDSADPTTFRPANPDPTVNVEAQSEKGADANKLEDWKYLRVSTFGFLPGLVCPHHDRTQSNGVPRYIDFDEMMKRHDCERGICIDHWCILIVEEGGTYELFEVPQMTGSIVVPGGKEAYDALREKPSRKFIDDAVFDTKNSSAIPGMWIKDVIQVEPACACEGSAAEKTPNDDGRRIKARCCAPKGKLEDILVVCPKERIVEEKDEEDRIYKMNPI